MNDINLIVSVLFIHLLAVMSPGPDFIVCVKTALAYNKKTGLYTSLGFALGVLLHLSYSLFGIAIIISESIVLFNIIKFLGALYLIYIGVMSFKSGRSKVNIEKGASVGIQLSRCEAIKRGFLTNALNPKVTLFFLSIFTLIIPPETSFITQLSIGMLICINTFLWFSLVTFLMTRKPVRDKYLQFETILNKIFGSLLIILGLKVLFTKN